MNINDFDYNLPEELIAQMPLSERTQSKLLCLDKNTGAISHKNFQDITTLLQPGDLLILNDTKVIPARLFGTKTTGGKIEALIERILDENRVLAQVRSNKTLKPGTKIILENKIEVEILSKQNAFCEIYFTLESPYKSVLQFINQHGHLPLPPYIKHKPTEFDETRYQTVFARNIGAVAAPTAALHFDENLLNEIKTKGIQIAFVTLHVGAGTYQPVRVTNINEHKMHSEYAEVSQTTADLINATKEKNGRIIAVGTTSVRTLETAAQKANLNTKFKIEKFQGDTNIFIYPGFAFKCVDAMITNFHLPKSTLLMLVSAFAGRENIFKAYEEAIKLRYRFFSYGDAMFIS